MNLHKPSQNKNHKNTGIDNSHTTSKEDNSAEREWHLEAEWTYIDHREWASTTEESGNDIEQIQVESEPQWIYKWRCTEDADIKLHQEVLEGGYPNRWGPGGQ